MMSVVDAQMSDITRSLHICIVVSLDSSLVNFRKPLIAALRQKGCRVTAIAPDTTPPVVQALAALGVEVIDVPMSRRGLSPHKDLAYLRRLTRILTQIKPDRVISFTIKPNIWASFAAARVGVPSVACVTGLGYMFAREASNSIKTRTIQRVVRVLYRRATRRNWRVIFQNPDDLTDFTAAGCLEDSSKSRLVNGSGVDMKYYTPIPLPRDPVFLMISRLLGEKGIREYCNAAVLVKARHPEMRFLLVGYMEEGLDGVSAAELTAWEGGGVEYRGQMTDVRPALAEANIYVLPSYREGTPRSVLEAMSCARAVITTDAPGCRETVIDGETGRLVPIQNIPALVTAMMELANDANLRKRMGEAGLAYARDKFNVHRVNEVFISHLELNL